LILANVLPTKNGICVVQNQMIYYPNIELNDKICLLRLRFAFFNAKSRNIAINGINPSFWVQTASMVNYSDVTIGYSSQAV
jgi:hypothetical protein